MNAIKNDLALELRRQSIHFLGIFTVPVMLFADRETATIVVGSLLFLLTAMSFYRSRQRFRSKWLEKFVLKRERPGAFPLGGAVFFFLGAFCALLLFSQQNAAAAVAVLALGDSTSTVVGKTWGKHKLFLNRSKSWEGSIAFLAFAFCALLFFVQPEKAAIVAGLTAVVEMLPKLDDNFTVPIAAGLFLTLL